MKKNDPEYHRQWYQKNRERKLAQVRAWQRLNRDKVNAANIRAAKRRRERERLAREALQ